MSKTIERTHSQDVIRKLAVEATAEEFKRSKDWTYKVISNRLEAPDAIAAKAFYETKYAEIKKAAGL
jgi:hypothetical protein